MARNTMNSQDSRLGRRQFLRRSAFVTTLTFVPAQIVGLGRAAAAAPSNRFNLACIGVGGRGGDNLNSVRDQSIVALCDVDEGRLAAAQKIAPQARVFQDYRVLLDQVGRDVDGVVVSTPDHTHAVTAIAAIKSGKHVYCEKPLAHSVFEVRALVKAAQEAKVITQLGNQGHSFDSIREFREMLDSGAIGAVNEVHACCSNSYRPRRFRVRPTDEPPVPKGLAWDLWLGPVEARPYHPAYLPGIWRGWVPFGTGIMGDWTCHVVDPVFWALKLGSPTSVEARALEYDDPKVRAETFPPGTQVTFKFPARGDLPPVTLKLFDGSIRPPRPGELEPERKITDTGAVVIGDKGKIMYGSHGAGGWQLLPKARNDATPRPPQTIPRVKGHHEDWIEACKYNRPAGSNFEYGGALTEIALLGVVAMRCNGRRLGWDSAAMRFTNDAEATRYLTPTFRAGWSLR